MNEIRVYPAQRVYMHHQMYLVGGLLVSMAGTLPNLIAVPLFLCCAYLLYDSICPSAPHCNKVLDMAEAGIKEFANYTKTLKDKKITRVENRALSFAENSRMTERSISQAQLMN